MSPLLIPPSYYAWMIPTAVDVNVLDTMAEQGEFPSLFSLYPSFIFAFAFGLMRSILQDSLFKVSEVFTHNLSF